MVPVEAWRLILPTLSPASDDRFLYGSSFRAEAVVYIVVRCGRVQGEVLR